MGNVLINDKYLRDIAAALRAKHDTMRTYKTNEMAAAIQSIPQQPASGISPDDMFMGTWDGGVVAERATVLNDAFEGMPITYVKAANAEEIRDSAFYQCESLTHFQGGSKTVFVNGNAFDGCTNLQSVGDTYYCADGAYCFANCPKLRNIRLYGSGEIGYRAFDNCTALQKIDIMGPIEKVDLGSNHFYQCSNFVAVIIRREDKVSEVANGSSHKKRGGFVYVPASMYEKYIEAEENDVMSTTPIDVFRKIEDYPEICDWKEAD